MVDEPQLPDTVPLDTTVTNPNFSLFRFHGRNQAYWNDRAGIGGRNVRFIVTMKQS